MWLQGLSSLAPPHPEARLVSLKMLYALLTAPLVLGFVCPPVEDGAPLKQLNEVCGGTCEALGKCADGLTCEKPQQSPFSFAVLVNKNEGTCQKPHLLGEDSATWAPQATKSHLLGEDSATWAPQAKPHLLGEDSATWAPQATKPHLLGEDSATWAPEERRQLVGGATELTAAELKSEEVQGAAKFCFDRVTSMMNSLTPPTLTRLVRATKQVVRGIKYSLTFELSDGSRHTAVVVDAAWLKPRYELLELDGVDMVASSGRRLAGALVGGVADVAVEAPEVLEAAKFGFGRVASMMNSLTPPTLSRVAKASKQVVAGIKYDLELELSDGSHHRVVVVDAPWQTPRFSLVTHEVLA